MEEAENKTTIEEEEAGEQQKPSIFPIFPLSSGPSDSQTTSSHGPQWLSNSSFTPSISSIPGPSTSHYTPILNDSDGSDAEEIPPSKPRTYELLDSSSPSDRDSDRDKRGVSKKKKKRKRKRSREQADDPSRKSGVRVWAGSEAKPEKDYYFDSRGDRDNLAFGSLYRMDIARYKLHNSMNSSGVHVQVLYHWRQRNSALDMDGDVDALDHKLRGGRYFSTKYSTLERHKDFKRVRVLAAKKYSTNPGEFIPLIELQTSHEGGNNTESLAKAEIAESWEDEVLRRTKEFNKMSRETPHDEKVWFAFAEFQDKVASMQPQKAARLQTLEKKISILEKAVELNPDNEDLLLCLLKAYQSRDSTEILMERWEKILKQHSGSCKLWKEFLHICQGEFSRFKVSDMRKIYAYAIRALSAACGKLCRQVQQIGKQQSTDPAFVQLELGLVDVFISLCRFEWQAGYQELATGLLQAEIEYSLFCPSLLLTEQSKQRLFEHFWNGNGARIGEDGALGWSAWLEKEEENRQKVIIEDTSEENEVGGWTGWLEPLSKNSETSKEPEKLAAGVVTDEDIREVSETENMKQEEDVESLLKKLGISVDTEADTEINDSSTWNRWSEEESSRDCEQWMPVRDISGKEGDEQLSRVILFEDVSEYLFSLHSEEARFCLVSQVVDFFGGKISQRLCTNSPSWAENTLSLETLPYSILEDLRKVDEVLTRTDSSSSYFNLESLLGHSDDISRRTNIMKFLRNAILLCLNAFPRNYILEEAVLVAEELFTTRMKSCACSVTPSRSLAKLLLKNDRQDLLLCGVYARSEAAFGNIDLARKIFDMALSSIEGLPLDLQGNAPLLYFWYAEMELAACTSDSISESSALRAIHILSCLGSRVNYTPFKFQASSLQLLRARQGFKEHIKKLRSAWVRGDIKDQSIAFICSAALFEDLTAGWGAGVAVFVEAFSMTLPERRSQSSHLEYLFDHYVRMFQKHLKDSKLSKAWKTMLQGLQIYPYNPKMFAAFIEVGGLYTVPNKLRQIFDEYCNKKPSVIVWLFALSFELGRAGSQHRIHGLFERALANDHLQKSVILWRCYLAYEIHITHNPSAARRIFFRAIHACPWSKKLWLDGFLKLHNVLTTRELSDLQEVMRDKELHLRTDIYEILLQDDA
ncbi:uncharacterized protein LOC131226646 [Magnolia sinica]|uniref:uncharacterized protein LOC131226646 n=1 Tax=Magnolia sinica TaxID=86752 RepID=UPI00265B099D|nr:uncharacterized protein LOC131226646 [Magnolia sinica]